MIRTYWSYIVVAVFFSMLSSAGTSRQLGRFQDKQSQFEYKVFADAIKSEKDPILDKVLTLRITRSPISSAPSNQIFLQGELIEFDARMPEHNHGMVLKAKVVKKTDQEWEVQGVKFHMPGRWRLVLSIKNKEQIETIADDLML